MNIVEHWSIENRLRTRVADYMHKRGKILSDRSRSNEYTGLRIREIEWWGNTWRIIDVDGMTCQIEKIK